MTGGAVEELEEEVDEEEDDDELEDEKNNVRVGIVLAWQDLN